MEEESNTTNPTQPTEETSTSIAIASETDDSEVATTPSAKNQVTDTSVEQPDNKDKDTVDVDSEDVDGEDDGGGKSLLVVHAYIFSCCN